jgi:predicted dinucleotide-binding enzyme
MQVGIIGGTGPAGRALAARLASARIDVIIGSRSAERAGEIVKELLARWPDHQLPIVGAENARAALIKIGDELQPLVPARGSVTAEVQVSAPRSLVAAAFQHLPSKHLGDLTYPIEGDVLICSDHQQATKAVADLVRQVPGLRPIDAGTLAAAAPVEAFTAVLASVNIRYRARAAVRLTGMDSS